MIQPQQTRNQQSHIQNSTKIHGPITRSRGRVNLLYLSWYDAFVYKEIANLFMHSGVDLPNKDRRSLSLNGTEMILMLSIDGTDWGSSPLANRRQLYFSSITTYFVSFWFEALSVAVSTPFDCMRSPTPSLLSIVWLSLWHFIFFLFHRKRHCNAPLGLLHHGQFFVTVLFTVLWIEWCGWISCWRRLLPSTCNMSKDETRKTL